LLLDYTIIKSNDNRTQQAHNNMLITNMISKTQNSGRNK